MLFFEAEKLLFLALRCCFAEINVAMAVSLWTRMPNNLGQIKPVVSAALWQLAQQFLPSEKKGERVLDRCPVTSLMSESQLQQ